MSSYSINNLFGIAGKSVLITGGGSGIGKATATAYAVNGAKVFIVGRRLEALTASKASIEEELKKGGGVAGGSVTAIKGDVGSKESVVELVKAYEATGETSLDVLINCAGVLIPFREKAHFNDVENLQSMLWSVESQDFSTQMDINVSGVYFTTVAFIPLLRKSKSPSPVVINVCSIAGYSLGRKVGSLTYATSKSATIHLSRILAVRLIPFGIRVNALCPGMFPSEMLPMTPETKSQWENTPAGEAVLSIPLKRLGVMEEIAGPLMFLGADVGAGYTNGAVFIIDGGRLLTVGADN